MILRNQLRPAIVLTAVLMLLTGLAYPGLVTAVGQLLFPQQAKGSFVEVDGRVVGSALIAQSFTAPHYFHPRPSAAGSGYDATASGGTNKGPTDRKLADTLIAGAVAEAGSLDGVPAGSVPADRATRSASGLDPHISPANAEQQIVRVAAARGLTPEQVRALVRAHTEGRQLGFLGEPRVNVLRLNLALDDNFGAHR
jgi:K+-transporting ATPase ATPase C chain